MNKILFIGAALLCNTAFGQVSMSGNKLVKNGQTYKAKEYKQVFSNVDAQNYFAKSRTNNTVASVLGFTGGFALGTSIPMMLRKRKESVIVTTPNGPVYAKTDGPYGYGYALIGAGLIGAGIPFAIAAKKNAKKAIDTENGETTAFKPYFKVESAGTAVALSYNF